MVINITLTEKRMRKIIGKLSNKKLLKAYNIIHYDIKKEKRGSLIVNEWIVYEMKKRGLNVSDLRK